MKIELKERTKVMNILESGDLGKKPRASAQLLARYYNEQGKEIGTNESQGQLL